MFEKATRMKLRFSFKGQIGVEDLWDLKVQALDTIYSQLRAEQKAGNEESLLKRPTVTSKTRDLKIELVEHVVKTMLAEADARKVLANNKMQKDKITNIIAKKQDESLEKMSIEDLEKAIKEL